MDFHYSRHSTDKYDIKNPFWKPLMTSFLRGDHSHFNIVLSASISKSKSVPIDVQAFSCRKWPLNIHVFRQGNMWVVVVILIVYAGHALAVAGSEFHDSVIKVSCYSEISHFHALRLMTDLFEKFNQVYVEYICVDSVFRIVVTGCRGKVILHYIALKL